MSNFGTSSPHNIVFQDMETLKFHKVTKFDLTKTHPPQLNPEYSKNTPNITAIEKWITPWPEISFEKVNFPKYEGIYQFLGEPSNLPDFIKDYHVISLARNIDYWAKPDDRKLIRVVVNSVKSK